MPYLGHTYNAAGSDSAYLGDALPPYTSWVNIIKGLGGVVTVWPFNDPAKGAPAARYDVATYVALFNGGKLNVKDVQQATDNNQFVYILAPDVVREAAKDLTKVTEREAAKLPGGITGWNPLANTSTITKVIAASAAVTGVAALAGLFRGRR